MNIQVCRYTDGKWNKITESQRWEIVREFFNSFMIDRDEIVKNQIPSPRVKKVQYSLNNRLYRYETDNVILEKLFWEDSDEISYLKRYFKEFEE